ncbi:Non-classical phosphatidylinositol transfer protein (PITP) [Diaporthe australafricana]|uniref:Phosphatidylinositol transfer protein SFH5 n=1 Tax=Diaporthe australafricana TaxID=127596 RepID=A0ABR3XT18_9PEZI
MADTKDVDATKVDATPAPAAEEKVDTPSETAQAEEPAQKAEAAPGDAPADVEPPAHATATEEKATTAATADLPKEDAVGGTESAAPVPAATEETKADEAKPAEEDKKEEAAKVDEKTETKPTADEAAATKEKAPAAAAKDVTPKKTPFEEFDAKVPDILKEIDHDEVWGVKLVTPASSHVPTQIVIQKFLNANDGDLTKAIDQFKGALKFRKEKKPLELIRKTFKAEKFGDLGAVTVYPVKDSSIPEVFTWNLYGNVKGKIDDVFTPLDEFMDYRIALQELGIQQLKLSEATEPITAEKDPYKIMQVHDYKSISFLRQPPAVKAASTEVIKKFALAYPELLKASQPFFNPIPFEKFFVNVPAIMGWMYALIKVFIAEKTAKKFHPMTNGANLAAEFKTSGLDEKQLPKEYGGEGGSGDGKMKDIPCLVSELKFE